MTEADLDDVARIEQTLYKHPWTRGNFADALLAGYAAWVMRADGELLGYFILMIAVDDGHLLNLSVSTAAQRRGYASLMIVKACEVCTGLGASGLLLEVRPSNLTARTLYERRGFTQISVRPGYYPKSDIDATRVEDALVMRLNLGDQA